jgi:uncharacterized protein (DUF4415 family)
MSRVADRKRAGKWATARRKARTYGKSLTKAEDDRYTAAALADPDARPATAQMWARALPWEAHRERVKRLRGQRGPQKAPTKQLVSLRIDPDVLAHFRDGGPGWQVRINQALRKAARLPKDRPKA